MYWQGLELAREAGDRRTEAIFLGKLALLEQELDQLDPARTHAREAVEILQGVGDHRLHGAALSIYGAIEAWSDDPDAARRTLEAAKALLGPLGDAIGVAIVDLNRGHVELAEAERARKAGDLEGARELVRSARKRVAAALLTGPANADHPGGVPSLADQSDDIRVAVRILQRAVERVGSDVEPTTLRVGPEGRWFQVSGGGLVNIQTRRPLRRLLMRFVELHLSDPERTLDVPALFEAGWPGEHIAPSAAANRVYVALTTLRKFGLRDVLSSGAPGYRIRLDVTVKQDAEP